MEKMTKNLKKSYELKEHYILDKEKDKYIKIR